MRKHPNAHREATANTPVLASTPHITQNPGFGRRNSVNLRYRLVATTTPMLTRMFHMYVEQLIVVFSLLGCVLFGLAAVLFPARRLQLAVSAAVLLLLSLYEIGMDRWEKTVTAPIRLDMFAEIPLMMLCLIFGVWQIRSCRKRKAL